MSLLLLTALCSALGSEPEVSIEIEAPWIVGHEGPHHLNVRYGDSAEGVRIQLREARGWPVGVSPIQGGRPFALGGQPMIQPPAAPERVEITAQGPDLVVRMFGPALSTLADRSDAPEDPALTWVRLRPRGEDWRIVLDGMGRVRLDGTRAHWTSRGLSIGSTAVLTTTASHTHSALVDGGWELDTSPSVEHADPYPRTAWTWRP